jgi:cytochrome oxidase Cu insertion factor (SCO1/SenC/PrrC family)
MPSRPIMIFSIIVLALAAGIGAFAFLSRQMPGVTSTGAALVGGPFTLTDHTGKQVTEKDFLGRHMLVFFGFTYCPDICPTELQVMTAALDMMGPNGDKIQPVFITVDPERDTPEVMKAYVENFGPRLWASPALRKRSPLPPRPTASIMQRQRRPAATIISWTIPAFSTSWGLTGAS